MALCIDECKLSRLQIVSIYRLDVLSFKLLSRRRDYYSKLDIDL